MATVVMPQVGTTWQRKSDGRAVVTIGRAWSSEHFCGGGDFVRCHPMRGGKVWFAHVGDFIERYERTA